MQNKTVNTYMDATLEGKIKKASRNRNACIFSFKSRLEKLKQARIEVKILLFLMTFSDM